MTTPATSHISIIIPVLNEEENLERLLSSLKRFEGAEVIVADGGSTDRTPEIARHRGIRVVTGPAGRGVQQNAGARVARGDVLVFLHCDALVPDDFVSALQKVLDTPGIAAGAFRLKIDAEGLAYRMVEWGANVRAKCLGLPYGDQVLFMTREAFERAGGFPNQPLLEDVELVRRLKKFGRIGIAGTAVGTSARRWQRLGAVRTMLVNQLILIGYVLGVSPQTLARWYYGKGYVGFAPADSTDPTNNGAA